MVTPYSRASQRDRPTKRQTNRKTDKEAEAEVSIKSLSWTDRYQDIKTDRRTAKQKGENQNVISIHLDIKKEQINMIIQN